MIRTILLWLAALIQRRLGKGQLSAARILGAMDIELLRVDVPEWSGFVFLGQLTLEQRLQFLNEMQSILAASKEDPVSSNKRHNELQMLLLVWSLVDAGGGKLFSESDVESLAKKSPAVISRLYDHILTFNGFKVEAVEGEAKN